MGDLLAFWGLIADKYMRKHAKNSSAYHNLRTTDLVDSKKFWLLSFEDHPLDVAEVFYLAL